ncbi:MAG: class I SAM-dependent methyltransferase [Candidatus Atribacteria bacterium]|nr:MAG: class I SAM-dependent methyltransferase [Candidatus Atribacteria bacterium]
MHLEDIGKNRMYEDLAYLWPLISPPENYEQEAQLWHATLRSKLGPGRHHILELGVGGGHNLSHFAGEFDATAVDVSEEMLENSRRLNPTVTHVLGDMRFVRLNRTFDAVLIHDAIDYMRKLKDLRAAFHTAATHLRPGGVFIVAPDYTRENFEEGVVCTRTTSDADTKLTYVEIDFDPDPEDCTVDSVMVYLIRDAKGMRVELDHHVIGVFPLKTWFDELSQAGFSTELIPTSEDDDPSQRMLFVSTLREASSQA